METILEQQRRYHEEKERLMDVMAKEMLTKKSTVSGVWARAPSEAGPLACLTAESLLWPSDLLRALPRPTLGLPLLPGPTSRGSLCFSP